MTAAAAWCRSFAAQLSLRLDLAADGWCALQDGCCSDVCQAVAAHLDRPPKQAVHLCVRTWPVPREIHLLSDKDLMKLSRHASCHQRELRWTRHSRDLSNLRKALSLEHRSKAAVPVAEDVLRCWVLLPVQPQHVAVVVPLVDCGPLLCQDLGAVSQHIHHLHPLQLVGHQLLVVPVHHGVGDFHLLLDLDSFILCCLLQLDGFVAQP